MDQDRILFVDDDPNWHDWIARLLKDQHELELACTPAEALELVRARPFSLVIIDQRLGATRGTDLLDELRAIQPDLQAILFTGFPGSQSADSGITRGVVGYFAKGDRQTPEALRDRVATVLANLNPIGALIRKGESAELEFKSSARWDMKLRRVNKEIEAVIVKTVAGFLNSYTGGVLLIGVSDDGVVVGLQHDYQTLTRHSNRDGFEAFVVNLLTEAYGKDVSAFIRIDFHRLGENDVCRVSAKPSAHEVYVDDDKFFLRIGNTTARLTTREANEYCRLRWPHSSGTSSIA